METKHTVFPWEFKIHEKNNEFCWLWFSYDKNINLETLKWYIPKRIKTKDIKNL